jgi:hypothetical protein
MSKCKSCGSDEGVNTDYGDGVLKIVMCKFCDKILREGFEQWGKQYPPELYDYTIDSWITDNWDAIVKQIDMAMKHYAARKN